MYNFVRIGKFGFQTLKWILGFVSFSSPKLTPLKKTNKRASERASRRDNMTIEKIKQLCNEELENTDIKHGDLCDNEDDYYILGKVDLATEILNIIDKQASEQKG